MTNKTFKVGDLVYIADDFVNKDFHVINKKTPALIIFIDGNVVKTLIGDQIHIWLKWDLEGAIQ
jgi:hypothetical protein